jgi:hypothetical protein
MGDTLTPKKFMEAVAIIVKEDVKIAVKIIEEFDKFFKVNPWPIQFSKSQAIHAIDCLLTETPPPLDPGTVMVDMMMMQSRKMPKLSATRKANLEKLKTIVEGAKGDDCKHDDLGLAPFIHGGGFTPTFAAPELICKSCGLNVTLFPGIPIKKYKSEYGIKITKKNLGVINKWAMELFNDRSKANKVNFSDNITEDPIGAYNDSIKWDGPIPFKIEKPTVLDQKSGS